MRTHCWLLSTVVLAAACGGGDDGPPPCNPAAQTGCDAGLACEMRATGGTICATPIHVEGKVYPLADPTAAIEGARVVALSANISPISTVAVTGADGRFSIRIPATRNADGTPVATDVLLRADAAGYLTFPSGVQQYFPVSTATAVPVNGVLVVSGAQTDIGLQDYTGTGTASIHGVASVPAGAPGVLVVAESAAGVGVSALADRNGDYAIYNLPAASYTVKAFARAAIHQPQSVTLTAGEDRQVDIPISGTAAATVAGGVQLVNPGKGTGTSVILVVESTFNEGLIRGETPPGLRAPQGLVPDLKGNYEITGVPPGRYVALAAYENDFLVRDPDLCIGGTQILHLEVAATGTVTLAGFKVTGSLDVLSPGATAPEPVTTATPTFSWVDDSSEDLYDVSVVDSLGREVWATQIPGSSGTNPSVTYAGQPLIPGYYYQFRVKSSAKGCYKSTTEDLKGVFIVPAP